MLIEFSVENFLSFNERVTLSLVAAPEVDATDGLIENTFEAPGGIRLLKSTLIYGANASGKSNFIKAVKFVRWLVLDSAKDTQAGEPIKVTPFRLDPVAAERESSFELIWMLNGSRYRYSVSVRSAGVAEEHLFRAPAGVDLEVALFRRDASGIDVGDEFPEGRDVVTKTRANALFLSVVAQFNGSESQKIIAWFREQLGIASGLEDERLLGFTMHQLREGAWTQEILRLAREADLGIVGISAPEIGPEMLPGNLREELRNLILSKEYGTLVVRRKMFDSVGRPTGEVEFKWGDESAGTQKFIALAGPLLDVLKSATTLLLDELDARLHPRLCRAIVRLFHEESNPNNAQLVAATHDTNLLDRQLLRRDQIWFTEKDARGATKLYSLAEFDLPAEARYERDYLLGKYGAVPIIGELVNPEDVK
ncbi:AAA family ATPase [Polyangium spumosum]|uniref:AAA family ATPase n=1 Tax=Polyangium spumosum TaxID=889282 RepID=A0A6N7PXC4_9BACT|nr:ATP-binding protein [Polyangium spumosum]MRG95070.1 AAA family ATPase [Polyangium spumosum]